MFYCKGCAQLNRWPDYGSQSHGPCEMCGRTRACFDVPSRLLPEPAKDYDVVDGFSPLTYGELRQAAREREAR